MTPIRELEPSVCAAGQIDLEALPGLAADGLRLLVNHRPDGESGDQPTGEQVRAAAEAAGVAYAAIPVRGLPTPDQAARTQAALLHQTGDGWALMVCRSGMRSAAAWAMGRAQAGGDAAALKRQAAAAGYDLSGVPLASTGP